MTFQPEKITREDVIKAINDIEIGSIGYRKSTKYDILFRGRTYPPKDVMRQAHKYATGEYEWIPGGGEPTNKYLKALGFEVVNKDLDKYTWIETHYDLVDYLIENENNQTQLIQLLKDLGITGFEDVDINNEPIPLNEIDPFTFFCYIYKHGPEKRLELLKQLATKLKLPIPSDDLGIPSANAQKVWLFPLKKNRQNNEIDRLWIFFKKASYLELNDELFQDILTITNVGKIKITEGLFNLNPIEYFPLNGPTMPYLKEVLGIDSEFKTFAEYKNILEKIRDKTNRPFYQISYKAWQWHDNKKHINYWIFQGSPKIYNAVAALNSNAVKTWTVSAHKGKIKKGDKFILWQTGANAGCYALGTIASEVTMMKEDDAEMSYYLSPTPQIENTRVRITIDFNLTQSPILWEMVKDDEVFSDFKGSNQGTNFTATKEQYDTFLDIAIPKNNDYEEVKKILDKDKVTHFLSILKDFVTSKNISSNDERISFNVRRNRNRLVFIIGNKYAFAIEKRNSKTDFWLLSKDVISEKHTTFVNQKSEIEAYWNSISNIERVKPLITNEFVTELNRNSKCPYRKFTNQDFINDVYQNIENMENKIITNQSSLNQILFGPPGTGKTFNTINEALKIVDPSYFETHQNDRKKLTERFKELLIKNSDENKGQIGFCTFHQSFSYEDFVEGIKPKTTDAKNIYYDIEPGIFKRICQLADSYNSTIKVKSEGKISWTEEQFSRASFYKLSLGNYQDPSDRPIYEYCRDHSYIAIGFGQENDFSGLSEAEIIEKCKDLKLEVTAAQQMNFFIHYLKKNNYVIISNGNKYVRAIGKVIGDYEYVAESPIRYNHFRKVEWLFTDELIPIEEIYERGLSQKTMYKIDETALKRDFFTNNGQETLIHTKEEKNYVLIIDEINRGNVSSIFGELITLIEKDKRAGCDEELEVTLPYSKEPFKVPNNVYLIGTMNTADRSIEALDTALRRRFSFKEFPPKSHLIKTEGASGKIDGLVDGIDLESLLLTINTRIEKLIDKDHRIGHSYFLKVDTKEKLIHAFKNEIIPLLEEYFFGDYGKIGLVLGSSFVEKVNHDFNFATFEHYDTDIQSDLKEKAVFRIKNEGQWDFSTI